MTARSTLLAVALASLLAAAGCGSRGEDAGNDSGTTPPTGASSSVPTSDPSTPETPASNTATPADTELPAALDGRTFVVVSVLGMTLVPETEVALTFHTSDGETATLRGNAGCNSFDSPFWITDGRLQAEAFSITELGCDQPLMDQDRAMLAFLSSRPVLTLDGDRLTLTGDTVTLELLDREVATPDLALAGPTWTIDTVLTEVSASTVPLGITPTLVFDGTQVLVDTGCNSGSAPVTIDGDTVTFGPLGLTKVGCAEDVAAFEAHLVAVLSGTRTVEIEVDRLLLTDPDTKVGIGATAG